MNRFCVPYVYAKILGCSPDEVVELLKENRLKVVEKQKTESGRAYYRRLAARPLRGVFGFEQEALNRDLGIPVLAEIQNPHMTVLSWARVRQHWNDTKTWIVHITGHALIYKDGKIYDNSYPAGVPVENYRRCRSRVTSAEQVDLWDERNPYDVRAA